MSLIVFGRSHDSGFSSPYHFLYKCGSLSILLIRCSKTLMFSRPLTAAQKASGINLRASA
jgi:hypothetical protein